MDHVRHKPLHQNRYLRIGLVAGFLLAAFWAYTNYHPTENKCFYGNKVQNLEFCTKIIDSQLYQGEPISRSDLARAYTKRGSAQRGPKDALADYNSAFAIDPTSGWNLARRGRLQITLKNYKAAYADFNLAIDLDPEYFYAIALRGWASLEMGDHKKAIEDFNVTIDNDPKYVWSLLKRARAYRELGQLNRTLLDVNRALSLRPNPARSILLRAEIYQEMGDVENSMTAYDQFVSRANARQKRYRVQPMQKVLNERGFYNGPTDGQYTDVLRTKWKTCIADKTCMIDFR